MFIGPCVIVIVDEWKTILMSLAILFHLLCAQHVSDINISIFRSLRLCWWITTSVFFSVRCVLELLVRLVFGGVHFSGFSLQNEHHQKLQHTTNWEQDEEESNNIIKFESLLKKIFTWQYFLFTQWILQFYIRIHLHIHTIIIYTSCIYS